MALSKKQRFEVFKRDGFICQYCGGHPPAKVLEVDHIIPVSKKGTDDINNLVTSCFDCNRGKSNRELHQVPSTLSENIKVMKEREAQYKEYLKLHKNVDRRIEEEINEVEEVFCKAFGGTYTFTPSFRASVKRFINSLGLPEVKDSMEKAISKVDYRDACLKYFCGVCWSKIRENE